VAFVVDVQPAKTIAAATTHGPAPEVRDLAPDLPGRADLKSPEGQPETSGSRPDSRREMTPVENNAFGGNKQGDCDQFEQPHHYRRPAEAAEVRPETSPNAPAASIRLEAAPAGISSMHAPDLSTVRETAERAPHPGEAAGIAPPPAEPHKRASVHEISLKGATSEAGDVKVRLVERGGDIRITVRSADADLTQTLRQDLSELVSKLQDRGFEARAWHPKDPAVAVHGVDSREIQVRAESNTTNGWNSEQQARGGNGGSGQQQQGQHHGDPRRWFEELDETFALDGSREMEGEWR
jgi:hypothetical protein